MRKNHLYIFLALALLTAGIFTALIFFLSQPHQKTSGQPRAFPLIKKTEGKTIGRIICGTPSITEIVFSLGEGERVVGVSQFSVYPPEARMRANIGGLINPNKERILSLRPDLFLTQGKNETLVKFCEENGIGFLSLRIETIADLEEAILYLGKELEAETKASRLIENLREELRDVRSKVEGRAKKKVFLTMGHTAGDLSGLLTTGRGTFLDELIEIAGGENIFTDTSVRYPQISKEALVMRNPEVIIEVFTGRLTDKKKELLRQDWMRLESLPAVRTRDVHFLDDDFLLIPGVRIAQTAERLAKILHPEAFDEQHSP